MKRSNHKHFESFTFCYVVWFILAYLLNSRREIEGIEQLESYLARLGLNEGWLLVSDRRQNALPIEERLSTQVVNTENQGSITVIRA